MTNKRILTLIAVITILPMAMPTVYAKDKIIMDGDKIIIVGDGEQESSDKSDHLTEYEKLQIQSKKDNEKRQQYRKEVGLAQKSKLRKKRAAKAKKKEERRKAREEADWQRNRKKYQNRKHSL